MNGSPFRIAAATSHVGPIFRQFEPIVSGDGRRQQAGAFAAAKRRDDRVAIVERIETELRLG